MSEKINNTWLDFITSSGDIRANNVESEDITNCVLKLCEASFFLDESSNLIGFEEAIKRFTLLGEHCNDNGLNFLLGAHYFASALPIYEFSENKRDLVNESCKTGNLFCNAITEETTGSNVFRMKSAAIKNQDSYTLQGEKTFISNASNADYCLAYAMTDAEKGTVGGVSGFILEKSEFKLLKEYDKMGLKSCRMGKISLDGTSVSEARMVGPEGSGFQLFNQSMLYERIGLCAIHVGSMKRLLKLAIEFVNTREAGGSNISKYQAVSHKVADLHVYLTTSEAMLNYTLGSLDSRLDAMKNASACKLFVSEQFNKFCSDLQDLYAGRGYISEFGIEEELRDARAALYYSGTNDIQRNIIAKCLGI